MGRWIFSPRRRASLVRARKTHVELVELGKLAKKRGMRLSR